MQFFTEGVKLLKHQQTELQSCRPNKVLFNKSLFSICLNFTVEWITSMIGVNKWWVVYDKKTDVILKSLEEGNGNVLNNNWLIEKTLNTA